MAFGDTGWGGVRGRKFWGLSSHRAEEDGGAGLLLPAVLMSLLCLIAPPPMPILAPLLGPLNPQGRRRKLDCPIEAFLSLWNHKTERTHPPACPELFTVTPPHPPLFLIL